MKSKGFWVAKGVKEQGVLRSKGCIVKCSLMQSVRQPFKQESLILFFVYLKLE